MEVSSVTNNEKRSTHPEKSAAEQKTEKKELYDDSGEKSAEQMYVMFFLLFALCD